MSQVEDTVGQLELARGGAEKDATAVGTVADSVDGNVSQMTVVMSNAEELRSTLEMGGIGPALDHVATAITRIGEHQQETIDIHKELTALQTRLGQLDTAIAETCALVAALGQ